MPNIVRFVVELITRRKKFSQKVDKHRILLFEAGAITTIVFARILR